MSGEEEARRLGRSLRFEVFKRDDWACRYCGARPPSAILHADHVVPVVDGGPDELDNLVTSCSDCNLGKGGRSLDDRAPPFDPDAPEVLAVRAAQLRGYQDSMEDWLGAKREFEECLADALEEALRVGEYDGELRATTVKEALRFVEKLGFKTVIELAECAAAKEFRGFQQTWRYFCGCCWKRIPRDGDAQ